MTTTHPRPLETPETIIESLLPSELLADIDQRTSFYDRANRFLSEDLAALASTGFMRLAVPTELGGSGLPLDQVSQALRRLAYVAPASALAVNMHIFWTGVAADLQRNGDTSASFVLDEAARGMIFAGLHSEAGNDIPILLSNTSATRVPGGWALDGHKIFGSLSPVWDYGGFHAIDTSTPSAPKIVHGFVARDSPGVEIVSTWDTLGMRGTQSHDTILSNVVVPDERIVRVCAPGFAGADLFQVSLFAWTLLGFASVYLGAAQRAFDIAIGAAPRRTSIAMSRSMAHHPEVQHEVAEMRIALDASAALLERTTSDWAAGVAHPDWPVRIIGTRHRVISEAYEIVDRAMDVVGGASVFKTNRLEQLFRDVRMGRFHPANTMLTHELVGKLVLGIDPDDPVRWG